MEEELVRIEEMLWPNPDGFILKGRVDSNGKDCYVPYLDKNTRSSGIISLFYNKPNDDIPFISAVLRLTCDRVKSQMLIPGVVKGIPVHMSSLELKKGGVLENVNVADGIVYSLVSGADVWAVKRMATESNKLREMSLDDLKRMESKRLADISAKHIPKACPDIDPRNYKKYEFSKFSQFPIMAYNPDLGIVELPPIEAITYTCGAHNIALEIPKENKVRYDFLSKFPTSDAATEEFKTNHKSAQYKKISTAYEILMRNGFTVRSIYFDLVENGGIRDVTNTFIEVTKNGARHILNPPLAFGVGFALYNHENVWFSTIKTKTPPIYR